MDLDRECQLGAGTASSLHLAISESVTGTTHMPSLDPAFLNAQGGVWAGIISPILEKHGMKSLGPCEVSSVRVLWWAGWSVLDHGNRK